MILSIGLIFAGAAGANKTGAARSKLLARTKVLNTVAEPAVSVSPVQAVSVSAMSIESLQNQLAELKDRSSAIKKDTQALKDLFDEQATIVRALHTKVGQALWDNAELEAKLVKVGISVSGMPSSVLITKYWDKCKFDTLKDLDNTTNKLAQLSKMTTDRVERLKAASLKKAV